ncbi:alpha/beta fold hydrolase [Aquabacterium sp. CECT 9606]|uniref:alpha/beta fold hydrolase n=1 Tax=Aquabacterium sp. CECT 9606 TaxID=2845822 RepID=UPI001E479B3E|nr:alpha/beta hydrolase [Aquabacterium sp. CECT 9606]CAH0353255.1 2-succinyl-6-hydroxy-2, 4-cyclohexadiene-1-carboxylate synthase [Aquabacterium sp. CECT 9606]
MISKGLHCARHQTSNWHEHRFTGEGGISLAYDEAGDPTASPVILLHGGGQTRHSWHQTMVRLADAGYHALAYDARGHGDSDWSSTGDYSPDAFVADLRQIIARLPQQPALVGASMGGLTSLVAIGESATPIAAALVLVDIATRLESSGVGRVLDFMHSHTDGFAALEDAAVAIAAYNPQRPPPSDLEGLKRNLRQRANGRWYWHWDPRLLDHAPRNTDGEALLLQNRREAAARRVRTPSLLVRGMQSDVVSVEGVLALQALIPQAELVHVPRAGHMVAGDRNDVFAEAVIAFLCRHCPTLSAS